MARQSNSEGEYAMLKKYCPTCCRPFSRAPVFPCEYGHLACSICCPKLESRCAFCCSSIGSIRFNNINEFLREEKEIIPQEPDVGEEDHHDTYCPHLPRSCPFSDCKDVVSFCQLYKHVSDKHTPPPNPNHSTTVGFVFNQPFQITLNPTVILQEENNRKFRFALSISKYPWNNRWITLVRLPSESGEEEEDIDDDFEIEAFFHNPLPLQGLGEFLRDFIEYCTVHNPSRDVDELRESLSGLEKLWLPCGVDFITPTELVWETDGPDGKIRRFAQKMASDVSALSRPLSIENLEEYFSQSPVAMARQANPSPDPDPSFAHASFVYRLRFPLEISARYVHYIGCTPLNICIKQEKTGIHALDKIILEYLRQTVILEYLHQTEEDLNGD